MDQASTEPLIITRHGQDWLALISKGEHACLKRRARRALGTGELSEKDVALIANVEVTRTR